ncbi:MAG: hypothetical protein ACPGQD_08945, partial [Planctomycetota bacterium]
MRALLELGAQPDRRDA